MTKAEKKKKTILLLLKIFPINLIFSITLALMLILFDLYALSYCISGVINFLFLLHPFYLAFLSSMEKDYRFSRRLLEMSLFLSPFLIPLIGGNGYDIGWAIWLLVCIYLYAAMIISWTLFYFIRKFYDKKHTEKAIEAEN